MILAAIQELGGQVFVGLILLLAGAGLTTWRVRHNDLKAIERREADQAVERENTFRQIEELFRGAPANPITGEEAQPGLVSQIHELRENQQLIGEVAKKAADDVSAVRNELTRNGGGSTKDKAFEAARSAEAAAAAAELAARSATRIEAMLAAHMANGVEIMEVGQHNDRAIITAIESLGGKVDYRPFPEVVTGLPTEGTDGPSVA